MDDNIPLGMKANGYKVSNNIVRDNDCSVYLNDNGGGSWMEVASSSRDRELGNTSCRTPVLLARTTLLRHIFILSALPSRPKPRRFHFVNLHSYLHFTVLPKSPSNYDNFRLFLSFAGQLCHQSSFLSRGTTSHCPLY